MTPERSAPAIPELALGAGVLAFAALVLWQITEIPVSPLYAKVGPTVFPYAAAGGLTLLGVLLLVQGWRGGWQPADEKEVPLDWTALVFVAAGLLANVLLITWLGFSVASTVMFVLIAWGFGSRAVARNALIGFAVALAAYFGFAKALGVNIGAGLLERWIEAVTDPLVTGMFGS